MQVPVVEEIDSDGNVHLAACARRAGLLSAADHAMAVPLDGGLLHVRGLRPAHVGYRLVTPMSGVTSR